MDFILFGIYIYLLSSVNLTGSLTFTTENIYGGKWITTDGETEILICRNDPFTGIMVLEYENRLVAECIVNTCKTYFTNYGAFKVQSDMRSGVLKWKISPITMKNNGEVFKCSDGLETLRLSPIVEHYEESLTFTTDNVHGAKWMTKNGATDTLICRNNPYTGKLSLIYEQQRVAECSLNSCKTYFTDYGTFNIQFDIKHGEIQWIINPVTKEYNGKLFKCSDGKETLRLSPVVYESLTFTTENFHDGLWIIKNGATDTLICRNNPYTGRMYLIYEQQWVAECSLNSCKTYFTDYGTFNIQFDIKNGEIQWKINRVTMKYNEKLFKCSDGIETLRLSPVVEVISGSANFISDIAMLLYAFILVFAIFIYAVLYAAGIHEDLNIQKGFEFLKESARNIATGLRNRWSTKVILDYLADSVVGIARIIVDSVVGIAWQIAVGVTLLVLLPIEGLSLILKTVAKVRSARSRPIRGLQIIQNDLTFVKIIGKGRFGEVWEGVWHRNGQDNDVALKTFKTGGNEQAESNIEEVELMQWMDHENVIQFYGSCINNYTITIVMELMENGNLLQYLRDERRNLETPAFVYIASQIVNGLIYLGSLRMIHRDLAARNILVNSFSVGNTVRTVKIADFGLARRLENENSEYIPKRQEPLPFRWTAPEAIEGKIFTFKSDVWSFGILLMEMVTFGEHPYTGMTNEDILPFLKQSPENRMKCPNHCHPEFYQIMQMCWKLNRTERPTFQELKEKLDKF